MPAKRTHEILATVARYQGTDGRPTKRRLPVGSAFTDDQGRVFLKVEALPVTPEWSGWLSLVPLEPRPAQAA